MREVKRIDINIIINHLTTRISNTLLIDFQVAEIAATRIVVLSCAGRESYIFARHERLNQ